LSVLYVVLTWSKAWTVEVGTKIEAFYSGEGRQGLITDLDKR
jgi:hypothetical protein